MNYFIILYKGEKTRFLCLTLTRYLSIYLCCGLVVRYSTLYETEKKGFKMQKGEGNGHMYLI